MSINKLFNENLQVINTGLASFKENLETSGVKSVQVDWKPPVDVDPKVWETLNANKEIIDAANKEALAIVLKAKPELVDLDIAINVIPGMKKISSCTPDLP